MGQDPDKDEAPRHLHSLEDRNAVVESALDRAVRRGDFDDLPGLGKPLTGLHSSSDPDWWIKQKMDSEGISGIAPAAFQLRKENAILEDTVDSFTAESEVRDYLAGFNARVRAALMDLRDGPPVFTPPRDVEKEVAAWQQRRTPKKPKPGTEAGPDSEAEPDSRTPLSGDRVRAATVDDRVQGDRSENGGGARMARSPRRWWHRLRR